LEVNHWFVCADTVKRADSLLSSPSLYLISLFCSLESASARFFLSSFLLSLDLVLFGLLLRRVCALGVGFWYFVGSIKNFEASKLRTKMKTRLYIKSRDFWAGPLTGVRAVAPLLGVSAAVSGYRGAAGNEILLLGRAHPAICWLQCTLIEGHVSIPARLTMVYKELEQYV